MKFQVQIAGETRSVDLRRASAGWECRIDGQPRTVDAVEVAPGIFSLLLEGRSFTVGVERQGDSYRIHTRGADLLGGVENPRQWLGRSRSALGLSGRQEITAPMPGKIIRILVEANQAVEEGQGLMVVEAMKMQNEIPSHQKGVVEKILVHEGDTVDHGTVLLVVA